MTLAQIERQTRIDRHEDLITAEGYRVSSTGPMLKDGASLESSLLPSDIPPNVVKTERQLIPRIAFDEPDIGPPQTAVVEDIMNELPTFMVGWMLPNLRNLYNQP